MNVEPVPGRLHSRIPPLWLAATCLTMARPKPVPPVARDLAYAGLDGEDDQGRVLDLHSLRVTFISRLSAAGVHPRTTQALARHAKIDLTMRVYTDLRLLDLRGAVDRAGRSLRRTAASSEATAC